MDLPFDPSPILRAHLIGHIDLNLNRANTKESSLEQVQSPDCRCTLKQVLKHRSLLNHLSFDNPLSKKDLSNQKSKCEWAIRLICAIDKTMSVNVDSLLKSNKDKNQKRGLILNAQCSQLLKCIDDEVAEMPSGWQKMYKTMIRERGQLIGGEQLDRPQESVGKCTPPEDINKQLQEFQSNLADANEDIIDGYCLGIFQFMDHFCDPRTGALKNLSTQEIKNFGKWSGLLDQTFDRYAQIQADKESSFHLQSIKRVLDVFDKTLFEFGNLSVLIKFLQSLGKPHFQEYHPDLTDTLISIFTRQLKGLNGIIEKKTESTTYKLEQGFKSKLVDAINKLLPDWQSLNNEAYLQLLSDLLIKEDESYWFDLIYTLTHHASSQSHLLSSDQWQETFLAKLEDHDPDARQMLAAIGHQNPSAALQVATDNHRLLWLKAFLHNQAGDHQSAYDAITKAEERCNELGLTPEPRLQLEIVRIKLASLKATATLDEPQSDDLHSIIKQLDKLSALPEGCNKSGTSALEQLTPWTKEEITRAEQLKNEAQALKKASGRVSPPQVQPVQETEEQPVQEMASPAAPPLPSQTPGAICQKILRHLQPWQRCTESEAMEPNDTFMVMTGNGKSIPVTDAMKQEYWSSKIYRLLDKVNYHRNDGDFVNELLTYQEVLTDKTNKESIGMHRLILELSWTLMRHADRALGENKMTPTEAGILLDYAWKFMMQSVCRAMHRGSPFPAQLSDEELIATVIEWIQALKDPEARADMEFFMRCALGSTAGHINGFRAELFPGQKDPLEKQAIYFFNAKHRLQPGYLKPAGSIDSKVRSVCLYQSQSDRWSR